MRRLSVLLLTLAALSCVPTEAFAQFNFGSGGTIHVVGASLPACTATMTTDYIIVDPTSATDIAGGAAQLFDEANFVYCDTDDLVWRVLASSFPVSSPVTSVHGRTGAVTAQTGDYNATQVSDAAVSSTLAGTGAAQGASLIGVRDVAALYTATTVEAALAEVRALVNATTITDISDTSDATTVTVASSTGADATLTGATGSVAGILTAADKSKLDGIAAGATVGHGDGTNCSAGQYARGTDAAGNAQTCTADDDVPESGDFDAAAALEANGALSTDSVGSAAIQSGAVTPAKLDATACGTGEILEDQGGAWVCIPTPAGGGGGGATNISTNHAASTVAVLSDTGTDGTINAATTSLAGVMSGSDKTKLDGIAAGATVGHGDGANCPAGQYPLGVDASGAVQGCTVDATGGGGATNLSDSATSTTVTVASDTGTDAVLDAATASNAGVMTAADRVKLDSVDTYYCEQYAGADIGAQCNAAYAAALAAGSRSVEIVLPRGSFTQSTKLDFCDESGLNSWIPIVLRGQGMATGGRGGTLITAGASIATANVSRTNYTVTPNVDLAGGADAFGRDRIECVGCDFLAAGIRRGDLIETTGFASANNNYSRDASTSTRKTPLKVYQVTATAMIVEDEINAGPAMASATTVTAGEVRKLSAQIEMCHYGQYVEDLELNGSTSNRYADIGIHFRPDNQVYDGCTGSGAPHAYCTGDKTSNGSHALPILIGAGTRRVAATRYKYAAVALTAPATGGQSDHFIVDATYLSYAPMLFWADAAQSLPYPLVRDSQLEAYERNGMRIASGVGRIESGTVVSRETACRDDSYGECVGVALLAESTNGIQIDGTTIEGHVGKAISVGSQSSGPRQIVIRDSYISAASNLYETSVPLLDIPNACGVLVDDGNVWANHDAFATAPTLTVSNVNQSTCPMVVTGRSTYRAYTPGSFAVPQLTLNDGIPHDTNSDELSTPNGGGPVTASTGRLVEWSQIEGMPAGFVDGSDDGAGGSGDAVQVDGVDAASPVDFTSVGSQEFILCTGVAAPDSACAAAGDVLTRHIANSVTAAEIATNAVAASEIATDGVASAEIAANAVALSEMADDAIGIDEVDLIDGDTPADEECLTYESGGANGTWEMQTCGAGGGDSGRVEDGDNAGTFTALADFDLEDSGDINFVRSAGTPDAVSAEIRSGAVGSTEAAALDAGDVTTGAFADARVDGSLEADELVLAGDVDGTANANDLDEASVEGELEGVLDLTDLQDAGTNTCTGSQQLRRNAGDTAFECFTPGAASLPVVDTTSIAEGSGDATKEVRLEVDGITTGTVRVLTMPDANVDLGALTASNLATGSLTAANAAADLATQAELDALTLPNTGQTDDRVVKTSGTTGDLEGTGISVDASNNVDGVGTLDADGAVTATSFTSDATTTPTITLDDSDSASEANDATITAQATDTGAGTEDVDVAINTQVNSTLTARITIDADGQTQINNAALEVDATDPADSGAVRLDNAEGIGWEASPAGTDVLMAADASEVIQITGGTLDAADLSGTVPDASVNGANEADELVLAGDVDGTANANDIDEAAIEAELEAVLDLADLQTKDIDNLTGQGDIDTELVLDGVEVDFDAGAANAWPRLLGETTPTGTDCDAAGEAGRLLFDGDLDTDGSVMVCRGAAGWKDIDDDGGGGGFTSFGVEGDDTAVDVTITDGNVLAISGDASGIDTEDGDAGADSVTISYDATEAATANEAAMALQDISGAVTDGQVPAVLTLAGSQIDLVQSAAPAPTAEGRIEWETDDDHLIVGDGSAQVEFVPAEDVSGDATMDDAGAVAVANDSHDHTTTTVSGLDISADTNLGATAPIAISGDSVTTSMATDRLLGRDTAATGVAEEITVGGGLEFTGSAGVQRSALTGDVTASAGSGTTVVANVPSGATVSVDETEVQLGATDRLVGRDTAAAGAAEELTVGGGVEFTGSGGIQRSALTGEVTASAGSNATTIADSVTVATWTLDSPTITTKFNGPSATAFPGTPATGDIVVITDDSAIGACDSSAGSARSLCRYNGAAWESLGDGGGGGSGDVTDVGDCTTGACFEGAGAETTLKSATDLVLDLDDDNNGTESLQIRDGANAVVAELTEAGALTVGTVADAADAGSIRLDNAALIGWEAAPTGTDVTITVDSAEAVVLAGASGITVPADSISDSELDEGAAYDWTGAHTFASTVGLGASATATTPADTDNDTSVATTAMVASVTKSVYVPAGAMEVDGTNCTFSTAGVVNSGPFVRPINCTDNAASIVYFGLVMPDSWDAGTITVEAQAYTIDASVTGGADDTIGWDVSCLARGDGETINSTWGTAIGIDVTFATQFVEEHVASAAITANDPEAGDTLYCRAVIDTTATDATTADMRLLGFKVEYATNSVSD